MHNEPHNEPHTYALSLTVALFFIGCGFLYFFGLDAPALLTQGEAAAVYKSLAPNLTPLNSILAFFREAIVTSPVILALQKLSYTFFGPYIAAARLLSALAMVLSVFIFYNGIWLLTHQRRYAFFAALILAFSSGSFFYGRLASGEAVFFFFTLSSTLLLLGNIFAHTYSPLRGVVAGLLMGIGFLAGGVFAYILPFVTAGMYALLKEHLGYNLKTLGIFKTVMFSMLSILPWAIGTYKVGGLAAVQKGIIAHAQLPVAYMPNTFADVFFGVGMLIILTLPWSVFLPVALWRACCKMRYIRSHDGRLSLPVFALFWLVMGAILFWFFGPKGVINGLWLLPPIALLGADFFDKLATCKIPYILAGLGVTLWLLVLGGLFSLPFLPTFLLEEPLFLFEISPFFKAVLGTSVDWGYGPFICGGFLLLGGIFGIILCRYRAIGGLAFFAVAIWGCLFVSGQTLLPRVYAYTLEPLSWMALKIKAEPRPMGQEKPQVVFYKTFMPSVVLEGVAPTVEQTPKALFKHTSKFVIMRIDDYQELRTTQEDAWSHVWPHSQVECVGGYCLIQPF